MVALALLGCSEGAAAPLALGGGRAVEAHEGGWRRVFDDEAPPRLLLDACPAAEVIFVAQEGSPWPLLTRAVPLPSGCRLEATGPVTLAEGALELRAGERLLGRWPARWESPPAVRRALLEERAGRGAASERERDELAWIAAIEAARAARAREGEHAARRHWLRAAELARHLELPSEESRALRAAAFAALRSRAFAAAWGLLDRAEAIDLEIGDHAGLARLHYYRALFATGRGDPAEADRALARGLELIDAWGLEAALRDDFENHRAVVLQNGGDYRGARRLFAARLEGEAPPELRAARLLNLGWAELEGQQARALEVAWEVIEARFAEALALLPRDASPDLRANLLHKLGVLAHARGDVAGLRAALSAAGEIPAARETHVTAGFQLLAAELALAEGRWRDAEARFAAVARADEAGGAPSLVAARGHEGAARAARAGGRRAEANERTRAALETVERVVRRGPLLEGRSGLFETTRPLFERALDGALADGDLQAALTIVDRARTVRLAALETGLRWAALSPGAGRAFEAARERVAEVEERLEGLRGELARVPLSEERRLRGRIARLERERSARLLELVASLDRLSPAASWLDVPGLAVALGEERALLSVFRAPEGAVGIYFDASGAALLRLPAELPRLEALLAGRRHLFVVPDGLLEVGFAGPAWWLPLTERVGVSFVPHAAWLMRPRASGAGGAVLVATAADLGAVGREAALVAAALGAPVRLEGERATRPAVLAALREAGLFHFAGHGLLDEAAPWRPGLRLAGEGALDAEASCEAAPCLGLGDVLALRPRLRFAFLNACASGRPVATAVGSSVSLAEAFLLAGADTVLATASPAVDDAQALGFAERFYAEGGAERPGEAHQRAARALGGGSHVLWGHP